MNINQYKYLTKKEKELEKNIRLLRTEALSLENELLLLRNWKSEFDSEEKIPDHVIYGTMKSIYDIQNATCEVFGILLTDLISKKQTKSLLKPRQIAIYLTREKTEYSTTEIGEAFGGRDHTTAIHSYEKIKKLIGEGCKDTISCVKMINQRIIENE